MARGDGGYVMKMREINLYRIMMPLKSPFQTHAGKVKERELIIVACHDEEGRTGYGEVTAFSTPFYTGETITTAWHMLIDIFLPHLDWNNINHPSDVAKALQGFQGNQMAKAGLEASLWDLYAKQQNASLSSLLGGTKTDIDVGVVISLSDDMESVLQEYKRQGYQRYKVKVEKYQERETIHSLQQIAPDLSYMIDGNGMYEAEDLSHLKSLDNLNLMMIEQPFRAGDFHLHQRLQELMDTPVCLDESIVSYKDTVQALNLRSCKIVNIKASRVGGMTEAKRIHDFCFQSAIPVWCGGMIESGISRAHNIALASLPGFTIPGDISASNRFWERDLIVPEVVVNNGKVKVPESSGIGFEIDEEYLKYVTQIYFRVVCN
jgi:O-succinylbenzoate synthase